MSQPPVRVVGVDGGATRTRCVLADSEGRTLAKLGGRAGLLGAGEDRQVADRIIEQVTEVALRAGVPLPVDALCAGLAGAAGRAESQDLVDSRLKAAQVARKVRVVPDQEVAFMDAFGHGDGILIISGTGSVAAGRVGEGPLVRVGGWGALIGDEGSGYRIGLGGLRAAMRAADGRNVPTALTPSLFSALGAESVGQVFQWSKTVGKAGVAALAPRVIEEANGGDAAAGSIVQRSVEALVQHVEALARTVPFGESPPVALVGGLVEPGGPLRERVVTALENAGFPTLSDQVSPVRGAVQLALET